MEYDQRIHPLMMCIRYWAQKYELSGSGKFQKITNYALTLMIIFYLQTEGVLPSVKSLQENLAKKDSIYIDGWHCGFNKDLSKWPKQNCKKNSTLIDWLHGFFEYFATFNYKNMCIAPNNGIPRIRSKKEKQNLCVQDPFELDFYVTRNIKPKFLENWKELCLKTSEITKDLQLMSNSKEKPNILKIFELTLPMNCVETDCQPVKKNETEKSTKMSDKEFYDLYKRKQLEKSRNAVKSTKNEKINDEIFGKSWTPQFQHADEGPDENLTESKSPSSNGAFGGGHKPNLSSRYLAVRPRDWICQTCGNINFAWRNDCFKCQDPKPVGAGVAVDRGSSGPPASRPPPLRQATVQASRPISSSVSRGRPGRRAREAAKDGGGQQVNFSARSGPKPNASPPTRTFLLADYILNL